MGDREDHLRGEATVRLDWIATDPETGQLSYTRRTTAEAYVARIRVLRELGEGYTEVSLADRPYPYLAFGFRGSYGVIHQFATEDEIFLLSGDGVVANEQTVLVPIQDNDDSEWTGEFVLSVDHAWAAVKDFVRDGTAEGLGRWQEL